MGADSRNSARTGTVPGGPGAADDAKEKAGRLAEDAKDEAREAVATVKEEARQKGREVKERAKAEAAERADGWTSRAGSQVGSIAHALRAAGETLEREDQGQLAEWSRSAAEEVERMSGYLRDEDPGSMLRDLEELARRKPGTFLGTSFAAGLVAGRFLRASTPSGDGPAARDGDPATAVPATPAAAPATRTAHAGPGGPSTIPNRGAGAGGEAPEEDR